MAGDTTTSWALRRLKGTWLFSDLPEAALAQLATGAREVTLEEGQVLLREGEPGDALYVVLEGALGLTRAAPNGTALLGEVRRGEHLGELALLEDSPRAATATALGPTRALRVTRAGRDSSAAKAFSAVRRSSNGASTP